MSDGHTLQEEDGFHEIQLNGKQLVFLGMTTTLVSVVIFLCGVLVGRGVKPIEPVAEAASAQTASAELTAAPVAETTPAPEPAPAAAVAPPTPAETPSAAPVPPPPTVAPPKPEPKAQAAAKPVEDLGYYDTLAKGNAKKSNKASATPADAPASKTADVAKAADVPKAPEAAPAPAPPAAAPVAEATPAPAPATARSGGTIAVQVAALTSRADAEAIARRLSGKGYAAYILSPEDGGKQVFKVRVGNYASADEAARVSRRLRQEEKLQPWVIR
jgi:DedD protein